MRLAFVPPRYGSGVLGGSEAVMREAALGFAARGHDVEIVTTTAVDHYTWENELPAGVAEENGMVVRRFEVYRHPSRVALVAQMSIGAGVVPDLDAQVSWLGFQFGSPQLFEYLVRYGHGYDAVLFSPYLFWTTTVCVPLLAERAVVLPCLHDESYARLQVVRPVLGSPALVWFLSAPEHHLAHRLGPVAARHSVTGAGVPVPRSYDPDGFVVRHNLRRQFVIFAGRREGGKGSLADACYAAHELDMDVVSIGKGELPPSLAGQVVDLGFVSDDERDNAFAAASAVIQPSRMESFSRTIMESWLAATPVVTVAESDVVAWHCDRSGGGLAYSGAEELAAALRSILSDGGARAAEMAEAGRRYVVENYTWPGVLDRMEASLQAVFGRRSKASGPAPAGGPAGAVPVAGAGPGAVAAAPVPVPRPGTDGATAGAARCLVVGTYPPVPGEPAAATLAAVRRLWASGSGVVVASPRPSAAPVTLLRHGRALGREIACLRRDRSCEDLTLCIEPGWPFVPIVSPATTARALAAALAGARRAELVISGRPDQWAALRREIAPLLAAASVVTASSEELAGLVRSAVPAATAGAATARTPAGGEAAGGAAAGGEAAGGEAAGGEAAGGEAAGGEAAGGEAAGGAAADVMVVGVRVVVPPWPAGWADLAEAGPLEPGELLARTRARRFAGRVSRGVFGTREPAVRARLSGLVRLASGLRR